MKEDAARMKPIHSVSKVSNARKNVEEHNSRPKYVALKLPKAGGDLFFVSLLMQIPPTYSDVRGTVRSFSGRDSPSSELEA